MSQNNNIQCCSDEKDVKVQGEHKPAQIRIQHVQPATDILETAENFSIRLDMPGLSPDDISVKLDKEVLTVEAKSEVEGLAPRMFYRQFRVMRGLDATKCRADYKQGVLALTLAKPTTAQPQQIKIQSEE
jgi:HSP20 family protein